jgi:hypothetical protein
VIASVSFSGFKNTPSLALAIASKYLCNVSQLAVRALSNCNKTPVLRSVSDFSIRQIQAYPVASGAAIFSGALTILGIAASYFYSKVSKIASEERAQGPKPASAPPLAVKNLTPEDIATEVTQFLQNSRTDFLSQVRHYLPTESGEIDTAKPQLVWNSESNSYSLDVVFTYANSSNDVEIRKCTIPFSLVLGLKEEKDLEKSAPQLGQAKISRLKDGTYTEIKITDAPYASAVANGKDIICLRAITKALVNVFNSKCSYGNFHGLSGRTTGLGTLYEVLGELT